MGVDSKAQSVQQIADNATKAMERYFAALESTGNGLSEEQKAVLLAAIPTAPFVAVEPV